MMIVRPAREDEVPLLAVIGLDAWERAVAGVADARAMRRIAELAFLSFLRSKWFSVDVAELNGEAAGWGARENEDGQISDLWVRPEAQRNGIGSALLAQLEGRIIAQGFEAAAILTHAQNEPAIGFFRKHGYAISSLSITYAPKFDRDVESVGMTKLLEETASQAHGQWI